MRRFLLFLQSILILERSVFTLCSFNYLRNALINGNSSSLNNTQKFGGRSYSLTASFGHVLRCSTPRCWGGGIKSCAVFCPGRGWNLQRWLCHWRKSAGVCLTSFTEAVNNLVTDITVEAEIFLLDQRCHRENSLGHLVLLQQQQMGPILTLSPKSLAVMAWETEEENFTRMLPGLGVSSWATCLLQPWIPSPTKLLQLVVEAGGLPGLLICQNLNWTSWMLQTFYLALKQLTGEHQWASVIWVHKI